MPTYEFHCIDCNHFFEVFQTYQEYGSQPVLCPECGSSKVKRDIKPIRIARSEGDSFESLSSPDQLAGLEDDPQALGQMMRRNWEKIWALSLMKLSIDWKKDNHLRKSRKIYLIWDQRGEVLDLTLIYKLL